MSGLVLAHCAAFIQHGPANSIMETASLHQNDSTLRAKEIIVESLVHLAKHLAMKTDKDFETFNFVVHYRTLK
jgi:hypothetical protein